MYMNTLSKIFIGGLIFLSSTTSYAQLFIDIGLRFRHPAPPVYCVAQPVVVQPVTVNAPAPTTIVYTAPIVQPAPVIVQSPTVVYVQRPQVIVTAPVYYYNSGVVYRNWHHTTPHHGHFHNHR